MLVVINDNNFPFYIKVRTALGIQPTIILDELCTVFGDAASSFRTDARWSRLFREGREEIEDEARAGRPIRFTC